jgi:hypothetical protein
MGLLIGNNTNEPSEIWYGSNKVKEIYKGSELVWPKRFQGFIATTALDSKLAYSADGENWTLSAFVSVGNHDLHFFNNKLFTYGGYIPYSNDGITWQKMYETNLFGIGSWSSGAVGNGRIVMCNKAVRNNITRSYRVYYSTDGIVWNPSFNDYAPLYCIAYGNNKFIICSDNNTLFYSSDAINWTSKIYERDNDWTEVVYGNNVFLMFNAIVYNDYARSTDGTNWTSYTFPKSHLGLRIKYCNDKFIATGYYDSSVGWIYYSFDGIQWNEATGYNPSKWSGVCYGNGKYVAVADGSNIAAISSNGINWSNITLPNSLRWMAITYWKI